ncbi:MAG: GntR family transcriptional regulator [Pseudomonadota bacterium]
MSEPSAADHAYEALRRDILSGTLPGGARLKEQALAKTLGLSRTPVRDALNRLVHEGFAERGPGYSTRVTEFSDDELAQIFELRAMLEGYAARRAATHATADEIARLHTLAEAMSAKTPPSSADDFSALARANEAFHATIHEAARSPRLSILMATVIEVGLVARTYRTYSPRDLIRSAAHHHEIADAIAARRPEWAQSAMVSHVLAARSSIGEPAAR